MRKLRGLALAAVMAVLSLSTAGCLLDEIQGFIDEQTGVLRLVYQAEFGNCFEETQTAGRGAVARGQITFPAYTAEWTASRSEAQANHRSLR